MFLRILVDSEILAAPKHLHTRLTNLLCLARLKVLARYLMYARAVRNLSLLEMPVGVSMKQEAPLLVAGMKSHHETVDIIR
jgi:hypothetical protein